MDAIETLRQNATSDFARSLVSQYDNRGYLSAKQMWWVKKLADEAVNGTLETESATLDFGAVSSLFKQASNKLKWPKVRLQDPQGRPVVLSRAGNFSKRPGSINVTDGGRYGENVWYGRIDSDGIWTGSRNADSDITALLESFSTDPAGVAAAYGKTTGHCCFCRKELTDDRSTSVGYGPVCAGNYGLPWG